MEKAIATGTLQAAVPWAQGADAVLLQEFYDVYLTIVWLQTAVLSELCNLRQSLSQIETQ